MCLGKRLGKLVIMEGKEMKKTVLRWKLLKQKNTQAHWKGKYKWFNKS